MDEKEVKFDNNTDAEPSSVNTYGAGGALNSVERCDEERGGIYNSYD